MRAAAGNIVSDLKLPEDITAINCVVLGETFNENPTIKKLSSLIKKRGLYIAPTRERKNAVLPKVPEPELTTNERFYAFILVLNKCFNASTNTLYPGFEKELKATADTLAISPSDFSDAIDFYHSIMPYRDSVNSIYISSLRSGELIKCKGINLHLLSNKPGPEVIYLKYFKACNVFLSKTFYCTRSYNSIEEDIKIKEINILRKRDYSKKNAYGLTFEELVTKVERYDPLQFIDIKETENTPGIRLDPAKGTMFITGPSLPLSPTIFLEPILQWLYIFESHGVCPLNVHIRLKHYNTYTTKFLVKLVRHCNDCILRNKKITVHWYYESEDDDMKEFGEYLQSQFAQKNNFHLLAKENHNKL